VTADTSCRASSGGHRAIWQLERVRVYDGGEDGLASTTDDNVVFAEQGVFAP
jgi:hypothetical protein